MPDTNPPEPSASQLLDEYKEAVSFMRHDDQIAWTVLGLCTTIAFGVWAYTFKDVPFRSRRAVVLTLLGVLVFCVGRLMVAPITTRTKWRKDRAKQIESRLGFTLLTNQSKPWLGINDILTYLAWGTLVMWILYLASYLIWWRPA